MKISTFGDTDKGRVRTRNEDMFMVDDKHRVYAVADGLGGLPAGALASSLAVELLEDYLGTQYNGRSIDFQKVFNHINQKVYEEGKLVSDEIGIGTTLTVLKLDRTRITIGHVGDCAVYLFRNHQWQQLTVDHTMEQEIRSRLGPDEEHHIPEYFSHTLTRCIGQKGNIQIDIYKCEIESGDRLLICSDGITKTIAEQEMVRLAFKNKNPEEYIHRLIDLANELGGPDNSTGIAIYLD